MSLYLDESGDLGFDFENKNPSKYFVVTLLQSQSHKLIKDATRRTLRRTNMILKKNSLPELKGANLKLKQKNYFYAQLKDSDSWQLSTAILDKRKLLAKLGMPANKDRLYNIIAKLALEQVTFTGEIERINLIIDRSKSKNEIQIFNRYILQHLESQVPLKTNIAIDHELSHNNAGLQAVDLFCWGISRKYEHQDYSWYDKFKDRIKPEEVVYSG
jgi:hypothetical protein